MRRCACGPAVGEERGRRGEIHRHLGARRRGPAGRPARRPRPANARAASTPEGGGRRRPGTTSRAGRPGPGGPRRPGRRRSFARPRRRRGSRSARFAPARDGRPARPRHRRAALPRAPGPARRVPPRRSGWCVRPGGRASARRSRRIRPGGAGRHPGRPCRGPARARARAPRRARGRQGRSPGGERGRGTDVASGPRIPRAASADDPNGGGVAPSPRAAGSASGSASRPEPVAGTAPTMAASIPMRSAPSPQEHARMTLNAEQLDRLAVDTIRTLAIDGVQQANSGHPGAPMGMAPMAYALWTRFLHHAPTHPDWPNRDRFVLSAGHASMLLYSLLHLTGYDVTLDDLRHFRQWGSRTPGHPEYRQTAGVEATTGPLGQGIANAVGMAIAERRLAAEFNRPGHAVIDHWTYAICSDGDLQEGIASEAASLAGHLRLGKLVLLYDDNHIQLDGPTAMAFSEDVLERFDAYGWHTQQVEDGNDLPAIDGGDPGRAHGRAPVDHRRPDPYRVRVAAQAGHPEGARRTARRRGGPPHQGGVRLGPGPDVLRARRRRGALQPRDPVRRAPGERLGRPDAAVRRRLPGPGGRAAATARGRPARRLGRGAPGVRGGRGLRDPAGEPGDPPGPRPDRPGAVRRVRGPLRVEPHGRQGRRRLLDRGGRPESPLRRPGARHGRDRQRHRLPRRAHAVRRDVPHVQRLHARVGPPRGAGRAARGLRLDP